MILSIYFLSLIFFILGWIYYYKPQRIQGINNFFRNKIFNDRYILFKRKKAAVVFFIIACILFTSGLIKAHHDEKNNKNLQFDIVNKEIILDIISVYVKRLSDSPKDLTILTKLAYSYEAFGEKNRELLTWEKILSLDPANETAQKKLKFKR
jgi:hypothetical protein